MQVAEECFDGRIALAIGVERHSCDGIELWLREVEQVVEHGAGGTPDALTKVRHLVVTIGGDCVQCRCEARVGARPFKDDRRRAMHDLRRLTDRVAQCERADHFLLVRVVDLFPRASGCEARVQLLHGAISDMGVGLPPCLRFAERVAHVKCRAGGRRCQGGIGGRRSLRSVVWEEP